MEIFRSVANFAAPVDSTGHYVLQLTRGEDVELLESMSTRYHREWWGVRKLSDGTLGYVPSKYLQFEKTIPLHHLPPDYEQQKDMYIRRLDAMQQEDSRLPDFSKPPVTKTYDEWQTGAPSSDPVDIPEPDYSDNEDEVQRGKDIDLMPRHYNNSKAANGSELTQDEWENIVAKAESDLPAPPDPDIPEPDYHEDYHKNGTADRSPYGSPRHIPVIRPLDGHVAADTQDAIPPHKLHNPCLASKERQQVHRELLQNKKLGIDVLKRKSELRKALDKRQEERKKKEHEEYLKSRRTVFEMRLEEQAQKLQQYEQKEKNPSAQKTPTEEPQSEFMRIHSRIRNKPVS